MPRQLKANDLRHRITILRREAVIDEDGYPTTEWVEVCRPWAEVRAMAAGTRQYIAAAAVQAERQVMFRIRYRDGITPDMLVRYRDADYDIRAASDP